MNNEVREPLSDVPLLEKATAVDKPLMSSGGGENVLDTRKRNIKRRGRRKLGTKKHRAGKNRRRKYKPYHKLSVSERQKKENRIEKRNVRRRKYLFSRGIPLAPPNTTQFLVADRLQANSREKKFANNKNNLANNSDASSLSEYDASDSGGADFDDMWQEEMSTKYCNKSDQELRVEFVRLEDEIIELEQKIKDARTKIQIFQDEVQSLTTVNETLSKVNAKLSREWEDIHCKGEKDSNKLEFSPQ